MQATKPNNARSPLHPVGNATRAGEARLQAAVGLPLDLIVVGGGISGAAILWDATLRGLRAVLVEKNDYASGTSQATSKLIHGGLRYLKNGELGLVRESLRERRLMAKIAPHAVRPHRFLYPIYSHNPVGRALMHTALSIYGVLSLDRNRGLTRDWRLPGYEYVSTDQAVGLEPALDAAGMSGAFLYSDYLNVNPERLVCEFIFGARAHGALAFNYAQVEDVKKRPGSNNYQVSVRDNISNKSVTLEAPMVVNATGPWADYFPVKQPGGRKLIRSKGIHVVVRALNHKHTIALHRPDGTHVFVIPWRGRSILGTTDTRFEDHPDSVRVTEADARSVIADMNHLLPSAKLSLADVEFFYGGIRPLTDDGGDKQSTYGASRKIEIFDHKEDGHAGLWTVLGGKYTTSRGLAESVVDRLCEYSNRSTRPCRTHSEPLPGGRFDSWQSLLSDLGQRFPAVSEEKRNVLAGRYGALAASILSASQEKSDGRVLRTATQEPYYEDELRYVIANEDIHSLSDLYFRRCGLGTPGQPPETVSKAVARSAGELLSWNAKTQNAELARITERYHLEGSR